MSGASAEGRTSTDGHGRARTDAEEADVMRDAAAQIRAAALAAVEHFQAAYRWRAQRRDLAAADAEAGAGRRRAEEGGGRGLGAPAAAGPQDEGATAW